jgi:hypothetical protein
MKKSSSKFVILLASVFVILFLFGISSAVILPDTFYGQIAVNGNPAPTGTQIRGMINSVDKTYDGPYYTTESGQYSDFSVAGDEAGQTIVFEVKRPEDSAFHEAAVTFVSSDQGNCNNLLTCGGELRNVTLTVTFAETCTNGQTRSCPLQQGVCSGSYETCTNSQWPGCSASNYGPYYENPETSCDNKDNDCDGSVDESITKSCGSGGCSGAQTCSSGSWGSCSSYNSDCGVCAVCNSVGSCVYDENQDNDCNPFDISGIATCDWIPDSIHYTWDYRAVFDSQCTGIDQCSQGSLTIAHTCSKSSCSAQCESSADCSNTECDNLDGCYGGTYRDYSDVSNTCAGCLCTQNSCSSYTTMVTDIDGDGYDIQCDGDCNDNDNSIHPGAQEVCDGKDNDCDGTIDENGCDCINGQTMQCGQTNVGECEYGTQTCVGGIWGSCVGNIDPAQEICNDIKDNDCDGLTDCSDSDCSESQYCHEEEYCINITGIRVLNATFHEVTTISPGAMYNIEVQNKNICGDPVTSMQIIQVLRGLTPINIGTVTSTISPGTTSTVSVGFVLPSNAYSSETFKADAFNWNHWIDQNPGTFEILSEPGSIVFQAE